jgi:hypothetical protein
MDEPSPSHVPSFADKVWPTCAFPLIDGDWSFVGLFTRPGRVVEHGRRLTIEVDEVLVVVVAVFAAWFSPPQPASAAITAAAATTLRPTRREVGSLLIVFLPGRHTTANREPSSRNLAPLPNPLPTWPNRLPRHFAKA